MAAVDQEDLVEGAHVAHSCPADHLVVPPDVMEEAVAAAVVVNSSSFVNPANAGLNCV